MSTPTSTSTGLSISPAIRQAFTKWLESTDNHNRARLDEERYLEYKAFLMFPNSILPNDIKNNLEAKRRWSNQKYDALTFYEIVDGQIYRRACKKFPKW